MEPLPRRPTTIPQARRFTRRFKAEGNRIFRSEDQIVVDIPPMKNTYLTKDSRLYFNMDFSFIQNTKEGAEALAKTLLELLVAEYKDPTTGVINTDKVDQHMASFYNNQYDAHYPIPGSPDQDGAPDPRNIVRNPIPCLDAAGPYTFFRSVEVYDYLGNTLLEKIDRHDLLASILVDYDLDSELDRIRPEIVDDYAEVLGPLELYNLTTANDALGKSDNAFGHWPFPPTVTRANCINLLDVNRVAYLQNPPRSSSKLLSPYLYMEHIMDYPDPYPEFYDPATLEVRASIPLHQQVDTWQFSIQLLNFLGKGSQKFVPLHNGYRLVFKLNDPNVPIKFSLPNGGTVYQYDLFGKIANLRMFPTITDFSIRNVYLKTELLEISKELDEQVDKTVHARMTNYCALGRLDAPTIVPGNYSSATNIKIAFRRTPTNRLYDTYSELGYRTRTFVHKAQLMFDDAVHQQFDTITEMLDAMGPDFDRTIKPFSFYNVYVGDEDEFGTGGYLYPYPPFNFRMRLAKETTFSDNPMWFWINPQSDYRKQDFNTLFSRSNAQSGKFLLNFDLTLNGYHKDQICGIDTTKTTVKVKVDRTTKEIEPFETDVFVEYDAIVTVTPDKYTSVSF
jgi:hypothetical protein